MNEIYDPKNGFEDLFLALLEEYKREIQAISDVIAKQDHCRIRSLKLLKSK